MNYRERVLIKYALALLFMSWATFFPQTGFTQDFQVSETGNAHFYPSMAVDSTGNFVIVWTDERHLVITTEPTGSGLDIYGQRFTADAIPIDGNFRITDEHFEMDTLDNGAAFPVVAMNRQGRFVATWQRLRDDSFRSDIYAQLFDMAGNKIGSNFLVNDDRADGQFDPVVLMWSDGSFIVIWIDKLFDDRLRFQLFDASGARIGSNQSLDLYGPRYRLAQYENDKGFLVVTETHGQIYRKTGVPSSPVFPLSLTDTLDLIIQDVEVAADGQFLLGMGAFGEIIGDADVYIQAFDSTGSPLSELMKVNDDTTYFYQNGTALAIEDSLVFLAWMDHRDGYQLGVGGCRNIYGQRFDLDLNRIGDNYKVTHEDNESPQVGVVTLIYNQKIYTAWLDGRSLEYYNRYPPALKADIWATIQDFSNPVPGTVIPCRPPIIEPPASFIFLQNFPNPFNECTSFYYELPEDARVELTLYNVLGQQVKILFSGFETAGRYTKSFTNLNLPSGVYLTRIEAVTSEGRVYRNVKKIVLVR